jgi:hypothetical protein
MRWFASHMYYIHSYTYMYTSYNSRREPDMKSSYQPEVAATGLVGMA